jgi:hypothetical protein
MDGSGYRRTGVDATLSPVVGTWGSAVPDVYRSAGTGQRPDPAGVATPGQLVTQLNELRAWAGRPSFRTLRDLAGARPGTGEPAAEALPVSTTHEILAGKRLPRLPRLDFVEAFVCACLRAAQCPPDEIAAEVERWRCCWRGLARTGGGEAPADPAPPARRRAGWWGHLRGGRRPAVLVAAAVLLVAAGGFAGAAAAGTLERGRAAAPTSAAGAPAAATFPDAHTTGVSPGSAQTLHLGDLVVDQPDSVVSGLLVVGRIIVTVAGVSIRDTRVVATLPTGGGGPCQCGILQSPEAPALVVEDTEIVGGNVEPIVYGIASERGGLTVRRVNVSGVQIGISLSSDSIVEDSYLHDLIGRAGTAGGGVSDLGQRPSGLYTTGGDRNVTIRHNTIMNSSDTGAAILFRTDAAVMAHVLIERNLLGGGEHTLYPGIGLYGYDVRVVGNRFSRGFFPNSGLDGPVHGWNRQAHGNVWQDNVWHDTGQSVAPD